MSGLGDALHGGWVGGLEHQRVGGQTVRKKMRKSGRRRGRRNGSKTEGSRGKSVAQCARPSGQKLAYMLVCV